MFDKDPKLARWGGLSVGVPGEVRGLEEAHRRWGKLPWNELIQPSIQLAQGWRVDRELGKRIPVCSHPFRSIQILTFAKWYRDLLLNNPDWKPIFAPRGVLLKEGDMIRRTNLSRTLKVIASQGADGFYKVNRRILFTSLGINFFAKGSYCRGLGPQGTRDGRYLITGGLVKLLRAGSTCPGGYLSRFQGVYNTPTYFGAGAPTYAQLDRRVWP